MCLVYIVICPKAKFIFIIYDEYAAIFELYTLKRHMKLILLVPMEEVQTSD